MITQEQLNALQNELDETNKILDQSQRQANKLEAQVKELNQQYTKALDENKTVTAANAEIDALKKANSELLVASENQKRQDNETIEGLNKDVDYLQEKCDARESRINQLLQAAEAEGRDAVTYVTTPEALNDFYRTVARKGVCTVEIKSDGQAVRIDAAYMAQHPDLQRLLATAVRESRSVKKAS